MKYEEVNIPGIGYRTSEAKELVADFLNDEAETVKITEHQYRTPLSLRSGLNYAIRSLGVDGKVRVVMVKGEVYLTKKEKRHERI